MSAWLIDPILTWQVGNNDELIFIDLGDPSDYARHWELEGPRAGDAID